MVHSKTIRPIGIMISVDSTRHISVYMFTSFSGKTIIILARLHSCSRFILSTRMIRRIHCRSGPLHLANGNCIGLVSAEDDVYVVVKRTAWYGCGYFTARVHGSNILHDNAKPPDLGRASHPGVTRNKTRYDSGQCRRIV